MNRGGVGMMMMLMVLMRQRWGRAQGFVGREGAQCPH